MQFKLSKRRVGMVSPNFPELRQHGRLVVFGLLSGPHCILQTVSSSNSTCKIHHETCRNEGIRKSRMQITKIRKIKAVTCPHYNRGSRRKIESNPSQPGGPSSRGRRIYFWKCWTFGGANFFEFYMFLDIGFLDSSMFLNFGSVDISKSWNFEA